MSDDVRSLFLEKLSQQDTTAWESLTYSSNFRSNYLQVESFNSSYFHHLQEDIQHFSKASSSLHSVPNASTEIKIKDYYDFLYSLLDKSYNSFPQEIILPGIRYISDTLLVFERPPMMKPYAYTPAFRESVSDELKTNEFYIPVPWQVYVCTFDPREMYLINVKMFFSPTSLSSFEENVYTPPLLNFYSNGTLCRPFFDSMEDFDKYPKTLSGIMASAYDWIWNSGTNFDITENISEFLRTKKHLQFEKYISPNSPCATSYKVLLDNQISSIPTTLHRLLVRSFFDCYSQIPLQDICSIQFSNPSISDFYYQENPNVSDMVNQYADEHDIVIHENNTDAEEHDDDYCPEICMYYDDIANDHGFHVWYKQQCDNATEKNLRYCCQASIKHLASVDYFKNLTSSTFNNRIYQAIQKITSSKFSS